VTTADQGSICSCVFTDSQYEHVESKRFFNSEAG
jgi:hypothetical protein